MYFRIVYYVAKDGLKLLILLPLHPKFWDCKCVPSGLVYVVLGVGCSASFMLGKHTTNRVSWWWGYVARAAHSYFLLHGWGVALNYSV